MGNEQRHDVLLTRLTPCTLLTMHYGGRLEALGPSFILSPLNLGGPTRLRPSLSLALSPSRSLPTVSLLPLYVSLPLVLSALTAVLPFSLSLFAVVLSPRRSSSSLSLSSSFLLSPHYPTHNRTRERDGATAFALHYSTAAYIASWSAVSTLSIVHTETREGSHHSLSMTG